MVLSRLLGRGVGAATRRGAANKGKNRLAADLDDDVVKETKSDVAQMRKALDARVAEAEDTKRGAALRRQSVQEAGGRAMLRTGSRAGAVGAAGMAGYGAGSAMMDDEEEAPKRVSVASRSMDEDKPAPRKEETKAAEKKMSFKEAFAAARKDGDKTFTWEGKRYTTEMASSPKPSVREGRNENIDDETRKRASEMYKGGAVKKYAKGGVVMAKSPAMANCGASMKPQQKMKK